MGQGEHRYEPTTFKADLRSGVFANGEEVTGCSGGQRQLRRQHLNIAMYEQARIAGSSFAIRPGTDAGHGIVSARRRLAARLES